MIHSPTFPLPPLILKHKQINVPLFAAPMAGITHSAFRRLVSDFGGYGAIFTEMLSGKALLHEQVGSTPFTRRRDSEGRVWYQLLLNGSENLEHIVDRIAGLDPFAIDLNGACPAPEIKRLAGGAALWADYDRLGRVVEKLRSLWNGILTVKCRLGDPRDDWRDHFLNRLRLLETLGIDAIIVHPRFSDEKLKRRARWELFPWIAEHTSLPVIANGDIVSAGDLNQRITSVHQARDQGLIQPCIRGIMIGRAAVAMPWIFRQITDGPVEVDYLDVWSRYFEYVQDDFPPEKALGRCKEFTGYFARNFFFGHQLDTIARSSPNLDVLREKTVEFLSRHPKTVERISVSGL